MRRLDIALPSMVRFVSRLKGTLLPLMLASGLLAAMPAIARAVEGRLTDDAYTASNGVSSNFGSATLLAVQGGAGGTAVQRAYVKFDLNDLPVGTTGSDVAKATLRLWIRSVARAGNLDVYRVAEPWNEETITATNAPGLGASRAVGVAVGLADKQGYVSLDVSALVKDWLDGVLVNHGLAIVAGAGKISAIFDSKEDTGTAHEPRLEIALEGPEGAQGPQGATGVAGPQGLAGPQGPVGAQGAQGALGAVGPQGSQGPAGAQGPAGSTGPQGSAGPKGDSGPAGAPGFDGLPILDLVQYYTGTLPANIANPFVDFAVVPIGQRIIVTDITVAGEGCADIGQGTVIYVRVCTRYFTGGFASVGYSTGLQFRENQAIRVRVCGDCYTNSSINVGLVGYVTTP